METTSQSIEPNPASGPKSTRRRIILLVSVCVVIGAAVAYWVSQMGTVSTDDAFTDGRAIMVAPHIAGYVASLDVTDNEYVHKGQALLHIQPDDYIAARDRAQGALEAAQGQLAAAQAELELAKVTYPARLESAIAAKGAEEATLYKADTDYRRQAEIPREATTTQDVDASIAAQRAAKEQVAQAEAQIHIAKPVGLNIKDAQARVEQLAGQVKQAKADLTQAELNLSWCVVTAPQDGWVTKRNVEKGNYVQVGQQLLAEVSPEIWVTANFKEDQLAQIRMGQKVSIAVDAYPRLRLRGHVDSIQLGSGAKFTAFPAENATGNFIKVVQRVPVKIVIDSGLESDLPLPLNLSVEPTVEVR
jgi:membrane fusion protein, multidrug efflux system